MGTSSPTPTETILASCIKGWWKADGNTVDSSGNGNDGTAPVPSHIFPGKVGSQAFQFTTDINAVVTVPHSSSLNISDNISVEAWVNISEATGLEKILGKASSYYLYIYDSNVRFQIGANSGESLNPIPTDEWVHIARTFDGSNVRIYINGILDSTTPIVSSIPTNIANVLIGDDNFITLVDEATVYDCVLTDGQIYSIYDQGGSGKTAIIV